MMYLMLAHLLIPAELYKQSKRNDMKHNKSK